MFTVATVSRSAVVLVVLDQTDFHTERTHSTTWKRGATAEGQTREMQGKYCETCEKIYPRVSQKKTHDDLSTLINTEHAHDMLAVNDCAIIASDTESG